MEILYNIDLEHHLSILEQNFINFSNSELGGNILWGRIVIINKDKQLLIFDCDLLKFSYDFHDALVRLLEKKTDSKEYLFNMYQLYQLEVVKEKKKVIVTLNKNTSVPFTHKVLIQGIIELKKKVLRDFKILYPNYREIKNIQFLLDVLST